MTAQQPWRGLAMVLSADRAVVGPEAARLVLKLIAAVEPIARQDGIALPRAVLELRATLATVAMSADGPSHARSDADVSVLGCDGESTVSAQAAAATLGVTPRHVRRIAAAGAFGPTHRVGRSWLLQQAEVTAYAVTRQEST